MSDVIFRAYPQFNQPGFADIVNLRHRVTERALPYFDQNTKLDRLARALVARRAIDLKELLESSEFYERTRKRLRAAHVAELCCGHGLTGLLYATEECVETVTLVDRKQPPSFSVLLEVFAEISPQSVAKVRYIEGDLHSATDSLVPGSSVLAIHACGIHTDQCIDIALAIKARTIATMPCCYKPDRTAPRILQRTLGVGLATDIHRTYRMEGAGYMVDWAAIPAAITPRNRILLANRLSEKLPPAD